MARTNIPLTTLTKDAILQEPAGTAVDVANGHYIDCSTVKSGKLLIWINNTFAGSKIVTVKAGANPPAFRQAIGDNALTVTTTSRAFVMLESARYIQAPGGTDGGTGNRIFLDIAAAMTGTIAAVFLPDTV